MTYESNPDNILTDALRWTDFEDTVKILKQNTDKVIILADTCHAGALKVSTRAIGSSEELLNALKLFEGVEGFYRLAASKPGEESVEKETFRLPGESMGHGAFTYAVLKGILGDADADGDGLVYISELFRYVDKTVPKLTRGKQHPHFSTEGTDIPIAKGK